MIVTVQDLIDQKIERQIESGICPVDKDGNVNVDLLRHINMASELLWNEDAFSQQEDILCLALHDCCACLPRGYETITAALVGNRPMKIRNRHYEFLHAGPGMAADGCNTGRCCGPGDVIDRGTSTIPFPLSKPMNIYAVSDRIEKDKDLKIHVSGTDAHGRDVFCGCSEGEDIPLTNNDPSDPQKPIYSKTKFTEVTRITKPITCGYIYLFGYDPDTGERVEISKYHPLDRTPCYRCYHFPGASGCCNVVVSARRRWSQVFHLSDELPVPSLAAYRYMIQAIAMEENPDADNLGVIQATKNKARKQLDMSMKRWKGLHQGHTLNFAMNGSPNRITQTGSRRGRGYNGLSRRGGR